MEQTTLNVIFKCYVIPRTICGLEVIHLTKTQLNQLERYHPHKLCQVQALPQPTVSSEVYMLLGAHPIEAEIQKRNNCVYYMQSSIVIKSV